MVVRTRTSFFMVAPRFLALGEDRTHGSRGPPVGAGGQRIDAPLHLGRRGLPIPVEGGQLGDLGRPLAEDVAGVLLDPGKPKSVARDTAHRQCGRMSTRPG